MTPSPFNRISFITLNETRLFTAGQVADLIEEHSEKVLDVIKELKELEGD